MVQWVKEGVNPQFQRVNSEFEAQFMTCSWVPQLVDARLYIKMGAGETFRSYVNRYWELYNEIGGGNEKVATNTFRLGLPQDSELRDSLTMRPTESMHQLIR